MRSMIKPQLIRGPKQAVSIVVGKETLLCLPEKVAFLPSKKTLLVSDLHWGKDAVARRLGCPIPTDNLIDDLKALELIIRKLNVEKLIVLGDLIDHKRGLTKDTLLAVEAFRQRCPLPIDLLLGNHDRHPEAIPENWGIDVYTGPTFYEDTFCFSHEPLEDNQGFFAIFGHLHPKVSLRSNASKRSSGLKIQAFMIAQNSMCLPAFSSLAGGFTMSPVEDMGAVGVAGTHLIPMFSQELSKQLHFKPVDLGAYLCQ